MSNDVHMFYRIKKLTICRVDLHLCGSVKCHFKLKKKRFTCVYTSDTEQNINMKQYPYEE